MMLTSPSVAVRMKGCTPPDAPRVTGERKGGNCEGGKPGKKGRAHESAVPAPLPSNTLQFSVAGGGEGTAGHEKLLSPSLARKEEDTHAVHEVC